MNPPECRFGLIGHPLEHSGSEVFFRNKFREEGLLNYSYSNFPLPDIGLLPKLISNQPFLKGFNVTTPYKEKIIPFLDSLDEISAEIGAVNTVSVERQGKDIILRGFNTDAEGFISSLPQDLDLRNCLILGTGGASKAVGYALRKRNSHVTFVSRSRKDTVTCLYSELSHDHVSHHHFVVNCTPAGMFPLIHDRPPFPMEFIGPDHYVYDLIYNPSETLLLKLAGERGAGVQNGRKMLENQALLSFRIWTRQEE